MTTRALLAAGFVAISVHAGVSAQDLRVDPDTGRDLAHYVPHRAFDHTRMVLELEFPAFETEARAIARCALTMTPIGMPQDTVRLDARGYSVQKVTLAGDDLPFEHQDGELRVNLPEPVALGEEVTIRIDYQLGPDQMVPNGRALSWSPPTRRPDGPSEEVPMLHSQGQAEDASSWFPCFDYPLERLSTELIVTVHDGYEVVSNGELVSRTPVRDGRVRWHWVQEGPHAPYLVSLVIGKFDIVDVGGPTSAYPGLPMPVYGPVGSADLLREAFAATPDMIAHFEDLFDEPYPWVKYSQAVVRDFAAGAMENTSASTFFPMASSADPGSIDDIIAHELVHQWFGDLVTCRSWAHLWLQEGWATYGEALWAEFSAREEVRGEGGDEFEARSAGRRAYNRTMRANFRAASSAAGRTEAPEDPALASPYWADVDQNFMKADNPYTRGACILHMLRVRLGDEVFWTATREYLDRFRSDDVETDDFRRVLEDASGRSLERFFAQWVYRAGAPVADVAFYWRPDFPEDRDGPGRLSVVVDQVQTINADNPAYAMTVPVLLRFDNGSTDYVYVETQERRTVFATRLDRQPTDARIDPFNWNILDADITRDVDEPWRDELEADLQPAG